MLKKFPPFPYLERKPSSLTVIKGKKETSEHIVMNATTSVLLSNHHQQDELHCLSPESHSYTDGEMRQCVLLSELFILTVIKAVIERQVYVGTKILHTFRLDVTQYTKPDMLPLFSLLNPPGIPSHQLLTKVLDKCCSSVPDEICS